MRGERRFGRRTGQAKGRHCDFVGKEPDRASVNRAASYARNRERFGGDTVDRA